MWLLRHQDCRVFAHVHAHPHADLLQVLTNPWYLVLVAVFGCAIGVLNTIASLINELVSPEGYTNDQVRPAFTRTQWHLAHWPLCARPLASPRLVSLV
jgi:hypothetical protein